MAISDDTFKRLVDANPTQPIQAAADEETSDPVQSRQESQVGSGEYLWESLKKGLAATPEMANWAARGLYYPVWGMLPDVMKRSVQPGAAEQALGVREDILAKDPGALTTAVAPLARGIGMTPMLLAPGPAAAGMTGKVATTAMEKISQLINPAVKPALVAMGASEGGELGQKVGGGLGGFLGGPGGEKAGELIGGIGGSTAGGYANVVRANAMYQAGKTGTKGLVKTVGSVPAAIREAIDAKKAGDERDLFTIYMDKYQDLRKFGLGFIQERTNAKIADLIMRDPRSEQSIKEFYEAAKKVMKPGEESLFSASQISDNPTLYRLEQTRKAATAEQAATAFGRESARRSAIVNAYKGVVDKSLPVDQKGMEQAINAFGATEMERIAEIEKNASSVRLGMHNFDSEQARVQGTQLRQQFDRQLAASESVNTANYERAFAADLMGVNIAPVASETKGILKRFESQIQAGTAPPSIARLNDLVKKESQSSIFLPSGEKASKEVRVSLRELDPVIKELGSDAATENSLWERTGNPTNRAARDNLTKVRNALLSELQASSPDAAAQYAAARSRFETEHVPMFKEGVASGIPVEQRFAGARGREKFPPEQLFAQYLNKPQLATRIEEFNNTFGGKHGLPRNAEAYRLLGNAIENRFSKEVLNAGFTPEKAETFFKEYESALSSSPETMQIRDRLVDASQRLDRLKADQGVIQDNFKTLTGSALTKDIGPMAAQQIFVEALADPSKMKRLLGSPMANSPDKAKAVLKEAMLYANPVTPQGVDYTKIATLMEAGQHRADMPNTLQMLTEAALGKKEGAAHLERLGMISELMRRDAMLDPAHLRILDYAGSDSPIKRQTGQTMASWLTGFRTMDAGFGRHYFPLISAGRFVNTRIQIAVDNAIEKALYDPETSKVVLSMASTPSNQPISMKVLDTIFGNAPELKKIVQKDLLEQGMIREYARRGAAIGGASYLTDQERRQKREERKQERTNVDLGE